MKTGLYSAALFLAVVTGDITCDRNIATADVFSIPNPDNSDVGLPRPRRGMTMNEVMKQFGPPLRKSGPVGKPPITRWFYQEFIVNFEHEYVIHSGVKRR